MTLNEANILPIAHSRAFAASHGLTLGLLYSFSLTSDR